MSNYDDLRWDRILRDRYVDDLWLDRRRREIAQEDERRAKERADAELRSREARRRSQIEALYQQYRKAFAAKDFDGALRVLDLLLRNEPDDHWLLLEKGQCFLFLKRYDEALAIFEIISRIPLTRLTWELYVSSYFWRGYTEYTKGDFIGARITLASFLGWKPEDPHGHYWRACCHMNLGEYEEAIADFTASLKARPGQPNALYYRGLCHLKMGDSTQGRRDLHLAIESFTEKADEVGVRLAREALK